MAHVAHELGISRQCARPGDLPHSDVKKLGPLPDGGGWRVHGRKEEVRGRGIRFDYVHAAVDDHTRFAHAEIHPDEKGAAAAGFLTRVAAHSNGLTGLSPPSGPVDIF